MKAVSSSWIWLHKTWKAKCYYFIFRFFMFYFQQMTVIQCERPGQGAAVITWTKENPFWFTSGVREKHQDWEAVLERALAEECSAPANLLELVRNENRAAAFNRFSSHLGCGPWLFVPVLIQLIYLLQMCTIKLEVTKACLVDQTLVLLN